jgi:DNA modification methylase
MANIILGDCLEKLKELKENSVDAIVTDPPYGLSFMGKKWWYFKKGMGRKSFKIWRKKRSTFFEFFILITKKRRRL